MRTTTKTSWHCLKSLAKNCGGQLYSVATASQAHLRVWSAFIHYQGTVHHIYYDVCDIPSIDPQDFKTFRYRVFPIKYANAPIPPGPDAQYPTRTSKVAAFKKGIKRDMTVFPILKRDTAFDSWKRSTVSHANAQGCGEVLTDFVPTNADDTAEFDLKQTFMYACFNTTLQTDKGKELVRIQRHCL